MSFRPSLRVGDVVAVVERQTMCVEEKTWLFCSVLEIEISSYGLTSMSCGEVRSLMMWRWELFDQQVLYIAHSIPSAKQ